MTPPRQSLLDSIARRGAAARSMRLSLPPVDLRFAAALTGLVALGPLLTIAGAGWIRAEVERGTEALRAQGQARFESEDAERRAAMLFRDAVRRPTLSATLDRIARVLPDDARLASVTRAADGVLRIEITTNDPDRCAPRSGATRCSWRCARARNDGRGTAGSWSRCGRCDEDREYRGRAGWRGAVLAVARAAYGRVRHQAGERPPDPREPYGAA